MNAAIQEVAASAIHHVNEYDYVTFVELERICNEHGMETKGDRCLALPADDNIILWAGMSKEFVDVLNAIWPSTDLVPAEYLTYFIDGGTLNLPLVKSPPPGGYKKPHWLPICFRPKGSVTTKRSSRRKKTA